MTATMQGRKLQMGKKYIDGKRDRADSDGTAVYIGHMVVLGHFIGWIAHIVAVNET